MHHKLLKYDALKNMHFITSLTKILIKLNFKRIICKDAAIFFFCQKCEVPLQFTIQLQLQLLPTGLVKKIVISYFVSWNLYFKSILTKIYVDYRMIQN